MLPRIPLRIGWEWSEFTNGSPASHGLGLMKLMMMDDTVD